MVVAGVQPVIPSEIRNAAPSRYIFFMESSLISLGEIIYKAVEKALGNTLGCPLGSQHLQTVFIGNIPHFHEDGGHRGMGGDIEVVCSDTPIRNGKTVQRRLVEHVRQQERFIASYVVVGCNAVNLRIGDRIDVNGNEDVGMGFIGNIAARLQFRCVGSVRAVDISIGGTGHDDFRTCRGQEIAQVEGDRKRDVFS